MSLALTLVAAVAIGLLLGLLGGGGSILTVPVLIYVAGQEPQAAIPASLFVVAVSSVAALIPHARAGSVRWRTGLVFGSAGLVGAYAGGRLADHVPTTILLTGFGLLMASAGVLMIRSCRRPLRCIPNAGRWPVLLGLGLAVGMITGMVGAGGGFVIVPVLVLLAALPMAAAAGTSLLVIALQASAGLAGHLSHAAVDWPLTVTIAAVAIAGSLAGARLAGRIPAQLLRTGFGWFLVATASVVIIEQAPAAVRQPLGTSAIGRVVLVFAAVVLAVAAVRHLRACCSLASNDGTM